MIHHVIYLFYYTPEPEMSAERKMTDLREEIANKIFEWIIRNHEVDCSTVEFGYTADSILSLPLGMVRKEKCPECVGMGTVADEDTLETCSNCQGSGFISRDFTLGEAVEVLTKFMKNTRNMRTYYYFAGYGFELPDGSRIEMKEGE